LKDLAKSVRQNGIFEHWCSNPNCPNEAPKQQQQQLKSSGKSLEEQLARTKAFIEMMKASDVPVEAWPACAGVFNKS
jgi:hypothetical protein